MKSDALLSRNPFRHRPAPHSQHPGEFRQLYPALALIRVRPFWVGQECPRDRKKSPAGYDRWPDDMRLSDLEPLFVCKGCGHRGADIRPDFDWENRDSL